MKLVVLIALGVGICLSIWAAFHLSSIVYADREWSSQKYWSVVLARSLLIFLAIGFLAILFARGVVRNYRLADRQRNFLIIPVSVLFFVLLLEWAFMFIPRSHGNGGTLGARAWNAYFWKPVNSLGYRDYPVDRTIHWDQTVIVVGDSFTQGHGIRSIESRFTNVLGMRLGANFRVFNLGVSGADTRTEFSNLMHFPISPDLIVLQYFANDIEVVCRAAHGGFDGDGSARLESGLVRYLIENSFLINFLYWLYPHENQYSGYANYLSDCFLDPAVLNRHLEDLDRFIEFADERRVPFIVVVFPFLERNADTVNRHAREITNHLIARKVAVLDVSDLIDGIAYGERVVNASDGHASEKVNEIVGDELHSIISNALAQ